jgi:two-component system NtrC family response regulator
MNKPTLLVVDDDEEIRTQLKWALASDYEVLFAEDRIGAVASFAANRPALTLLDLGLPPHPNSTVEGMGILSALLAEDHEARVVVVSGQGEKLNGAKAVGAGACDFLCKPVDIDQLRTILQAHLRPAVFRREFVESQSGPLPEKFQGMVVQCEAMRAVCSSLTKVAKTNAPVLITGKSGTGKEMAARAIHHLSNRKDGPFMAINCNAIPESLIESELFGHEKGAFTGAVAQRKGLVECADGGTLFLDEIGEVPALTQPKLLRFLQEKKFQRVGGRQEIESDTRVVAATNANLEEMVAAGTFREDLYFRLAVIAIRLPSLAERGSDIMLLAYDYLDRYARQGGLKNVKFAPDAIQAMTEHTWPGNIRELQNRVQRAVILGEGKFLTAGDLELDHLAGSRVRTLREAREDAERSAVLASLARNQRKISAAAIELGISRPTLYELMEKLGIARD